MIIVNNHLSLRFCLASRTVCVLGMLSTIKVYEQLSFTFILLPICLSWELRWWPDDMMPSALHLCEAPPNQKLMTRLPLELSQEG